MILIVKVSVIVRDIGVVDGSKCESCFTRIIISSFHSINSFASSIPIQSCLPWQWRKILSIDLQFLFRTTHRIEFRDKSKCEKSIINKEDSPTATVKMYVGKFKINIASYFQRNVKLTLLRLFVASWNLNIVSWTFLHSQSK